MLRIFDAHVHLFDSEANTHAFLEREDPTFKIPRRRLFDAAAALSDR